MRILHPRQPVYIVPRGDGRFMIGATMIENEERSRLTVRSMLELLNAAYAMHPAFAEAEVVETGSDVRPAFPDNLPRIVPPRRGYLRQRPLPAWFPAGAGARRRAVAVVFEVRIFRRSWMQIRVNGEALDVAATTLAALLAELDYEGMTVATAVNQNFVRAEDRKETKLAPGDAVEILVPKQGG